MLLTAHCIKLGLSIKYLSAIIVKMKITCLITAYSQLSAVLRLGSATLSKPFIQN